MPLTTPSNLPHAPAPYSRVAYPARVAPWVPSGRSLHLIDVENLVGRPRPGPEALRIALASYRQAAGFREGDHTRIGCHPGLALAVHDAWPGAQIRVGHGPDGADHALLDRVDPDDVARRFFRVCVGSGDWIFGDLLHALRKRGVEVCVVSRRRSTARQIRKIARTTYVSTPALACSAAAG